LRIGLVGVGAAAQISHIPTLMRTEGLELVALCDRDPEKAQRVAQKFQIPIASSRLDDLLEDDTLDAIDICTPNFLHAPMATAALEAGKHVLCERPLARSADEASQMVKVARKADRVLMCAVQHRFRPDAQLLRKVVEKGDLGEIFFAKAGWLRQRTEWTPTSGVGRNASPAAVSCSISASRCSISPCGCSEVRKSSPSRRVFTGCEREKSRTARPRSSGFRAEQR
jgi:predicted dehydrogenase